MSKQTLQQIYGINADLVGKGKIHGTTPEEVREHLKVFDLTQGERNFFIEAWMQRHTVVHKTITIKSVADVADMSYGHARRCAAHLAELGLLTINKERRPFRLRLPRFSVLIQKIRVLVEKFTRPRDKFHPERMRLEGEEQPRPAPLPAPQPEPEPEPLPIAAAVRAPEWELAFPKIQQKVSRAAFQSWFEGTRGYRQGGLLVIETNTTYQRQHLLMHFADLINSIFGQGRWAVAVKASA